MSIVVLRILSDSSCACDLRLNSALTVDPYVFDAASVTLDTGICALLWFFTMVIVGCALRAVVLDA